MIVRLVIPALLLMFMGSLHAQNVFVKKGDKLMRRHNFKRAAAMYSKAADADINNLDAREKLGNALIASADYDSAIAVYKSLADNPLSKAQCLFTYAQLLRVQGKYAEADSAYKAFAVKAPDDPRAIELRNFGNDIQPLLTDTKNYEFATLPENTANSEIGPAYNAGKLVFVSNRGKGNAIRMVDSWTGKGYYDLYEQRGAAAGDSVVPAKLKGKVNKRLNEGPATFSRDGKEMIFTRTNYGVKGADGIMHLGLYRADYDEKKNKWVNIRPLPFNSSEYNVAHPTLSKDGHRLYFVSDMPGGLGETDIYV
ncbi:MAG TPA: hypothetical protein PLW44_10470, partial [Chitinophagales bacterium]|nr:hypothetical protein [Chitinophagales bacterium]